MKAYFVADFGLPRSNFSIYASGDQLSPVEDHPTFAHHVTMNDKPYIPLSLQTIDMITQHSWIEIFMFWKALANESRYQGWSWLQGATPRINIFSYENLNGYELIFYPHLTLLVKGRDDYRDSGTDLVELHVMMTSMLFPGDDARSSRTEIWINEDMFFDAEWKKGHTSITRSLNKAVRTVREKHHVIRKSDAEMNATLFVVDIDEVDVGFDSIDERDSFKLDVIKEYTTP